MWDLNSPIQGLIPHLRWEVVKLDYEGSPVRILKSWFSCITQVIFSWITTIRKETCSNVFCFKKQNKKSFWLLSCFSAPLHCKPPWKHCLWSLLQSSPIFSSTCSNRFHPHDSIETAFIKVSFDLHVAKSIILFWDLLKLFGSLWPCWLQGQHPPWNSSAFCITILPWLSFIYTGFSFSVSFLILGCWLQHIVCFPLSQGLVPGHRLFLICLSVFPIWSYLVPWLEVPTIC